MSFSNVLLAFDSFKGSLSSKDVATSVADTLQSLNPHLTIETCLMSDGGEGLLDALTEILSLQTIEVTILDPLQKPRSAYYGWHEATQLAVIESAQANGLPLVPHSQRNPMKTTAYGVGELILAALDRGAKTVMIGLGGSATNESGLSILQALGWKFLDQTGQELPIITGECLSRIHTIQSDNADSRLKETKFIAACDVNNPLIGQLGATYTYGPQKGGTPEQLDALEEAMKNIAQQIRHKTDINLADLPGAGAAGGIAGGLHAFLNAELTPGIDVILKAQGFDEKLAKADLVMTGEGKSDAQTLMGKVPMGVLKKALEQRVPVVLVSGMIDNPDTLKAAGFEQTIAIKPTYQSIEEAIKPNVAKANLEAAILKYFA